MAMANPASAAKRTFLAQNAVDTADMVLLALGGRVLGTDPEMRLGIKGPGGVSTDGGKTARQALTLVRADRQDAVMIGWMDVATRQAALRPFENARCLYAARFQTTAPFASEEYAAFADQLRATLSQHGFTVDEEVAEVPRASLTTRGASAGAGRWLPVAVAVATAVLAAVAFAVR
ncbi:MAG: hypothetical protein AAGH15_27905 [Myxococcota bacterium]